MYGKGKSNSSAVPSDSQARENVVEVQGVEYTGLSGLKLVTLDLFTSFSPQNSASVVYEYSYSETLMVSLSTSLLVLIPKTYFLANNALLHGFHVPSLPSEGIIPQLLHNFWRRIKAIYHNQKLELNPVQQGGILTQTKEITCPLHWIALPFSPSRSGVVMLVMAKPVDTGIHSTEAPNNCTPVGLVTCFLTATERTKVPAAFIVAMVLFLLMRALLNIGEDCLMMQEVSHVHEYPVLTVMMSKVLTVMMSTVLTYDVYSTNYYVYGTDCYVYSTDCYYVYSTDCSVYSTDCYYVYSTDCIVTV
ncbi:hypothetical protein STEG23_028173, partial [Scotinomys teguina]